MPTIQQAADAADHVLGNAGLSDAYDECLDELWQYCENRDADDLPRWRRDLRALERSLAPAATRLGLHTPAQLEPWPDPEPGALTTATPHGYLVLISTGLAQLAVLSARLYGLHAVGARNSARARELTLEAVELMLDGEDVGPLADSVVLARPAAEQASVMASSALRFVAAHEYAHCCLGHLERLAAAPALDVCDPFGLATQELHDHLWERDADDLGLRMLAGMFLPRQRAALEPPMALGPVVLLSHLALHQAVYFEWGAFRFGAEHPPAELRLLALVAALEQIGTPLVRDCVHRYIEDWHRPMQQQVRALAHRG